MVQKRGRMNDEARTSAAWTLSIFAITSFILVISSWSLASVALWLLYWPLGIPASRGGMMCVDVICGLQYDPSFEEDSYSRAALVVYAFWPLAVPLLCIAAFAVSMFRVALRQIG